MKKVQQKKTTSTKTKQSTASGKPPRPLADAPPAFWEGVKIATTEPSPRVDPWADAERRLFGKPNYHYEMNEASTEDMLRSAICTHGGEDTVTDAIITAADELYMVMNGIENAPDSERSGRSSDGSASLPSSCSAFSA
jgi:hypothetical protein